MYDDLNFMFLSWGDLLDIEIGRAHISVRSKSVADYQYVKHELLGAKTGLNVIKYVYFNPNSSIYDIAENVNYSQSHIRKQIRLINKFLKRYKSKIEYNTQTRTYSILSKKEIALHYLIVEIMKITSKKIELPELNQQQKDDFDKLFSSILTQFLSDTQETFELLFRAEKLRINQDLVDEDRTFHYLEALENVHDTEIISQARVYVEERLRWYYAGLKTNLTEDDYLVMVDIVEGYILRSYILPERFDSYLNRYDMFLHDFARVNPKYIGIYMDFMDDINIHSGVNVSDYAGEIMYHIYECIKYS